MSNTDLANAAPQMALILAAGLGSRLRPQIKTPKPLTKVLGLTLAERVVCTLLDAGIRRFLVTLGHEAETVRAHFSDIARRRGVTIDFVGAEDWERGNGASALAAKGRTGEAPFFLVMVDHLFDPTIALALGGALAQLASIIDGCDGEIARLKHSQSEFGGWFDAVLDRHADAILLFGLMWHEFAATGTNLSVVLGFAAIVGSFLNSYTADKYDGLMAQRLHGASYFRLGRDVRVFVIFLGALLNLPLVTLGVVALVMNVEVVRRIIVCASVEPEQHPFRPQHPLTRVKLP